jgi:hypothetical protein
MDQRSRLLARPFAVCGVLLVPWIGVMIEQLHGQAGKRSFSSSGASFGDGLPDQLGDVEDQIRSGLTRLAGIANLTHTDADHVVEPTVGLTVSRVKQRAYDLTALRRVGAPISVPLNHISGWWHCDNE